MARASHRGKKFRELRYSLRMGEQIQICEQRNFGNFWPQTTQAALQRTQIVEMSGAEVERHNRRQTVCRQTSDFAFDE